MVMACLWPIIQGMEAKLAQAECWHWATIRSKQDAAVEIVGHAPSGPVLTGLLELCLLALLQPSP